MKCERCGKELRDTDLYCPRCGQAVFPEYMDEEETWEFYKSDAELTQIMKAEEEENPEEIKAEENSDQEESETKMEADTETDVEEEMEPEQSEIGESNLEEQMISETETDDPEWISEEENLEKFPGSGEDDEEEITEQKLEEDEGDEEEEDEEDEEQKLPLTPERKRARRMAAFISTLFLVGCLTVGILLGLGHMKKMEKQQKDYYHSLGLDDSKTVSKVQNNTKKQEPKPENPVKETADESKTDSQPEEKDEVKPETQEEDSKGEEPKKEEPKKEEYFKLVKADDIDFSKYKKIQPASAEGNSKKVSESYDYGAKSAIDNDIKSSWQEGEEGLGEGKGFKLTLDGNHKIRYMVLYLGNWRKTELWEYNARPKVLTIEVGENQKKEVEFSDEMKKFCLSFDEPVDASYVSMYIKSAYKGSRWDDNCISEIELYE